MPASPCEEVRGARHSWTSHGDCAFFYETTRKDFPLGVFLSIIYDNQLTSMQPKQDSRRLKRERVDAGASAQHEFPIRDYCNLWASIRTVDCARSDLCIPCAYKIGCFDVALDKKFCKAVPNRRPEQCPRSKRTTTTSEEGILGFRRGTRALAVGEGDLSFSLALAQLGVTLTATSYESRETLERVYPDVVATITRLKSLAVDVRFEVDATRLDDTLPAICRRTFERVIWNFPCSAIAQGQDGQNKEMELNKELVRKFLVNAGRYLESDGQIHINHKTKVSDTAWHNSSFCQRVSHLPHTSLCLVYLTVKASIQSVEHRRHCPRLWLSVCRQGRVGPVPLATVHASQGTGP
jgi:hypothetical protein